ncbi:MAG: dihydrolipoamide acetyltransferase, partial [Deltaproteobacteria bacterium]|nr:dihydrolipoamide acetyltransferase [Deltaproteobacteria bacterium]
SIPETADAAFTARVKTLEEQIGDLKEKILLSKSRLQTLQEKVLGGDISSGARVVLVHNKELSSAFVMQSISYVLDGAPVKSRVNKDGDLDKESTFEVFNGPIVPGNRQVTVRMVLTAGTRGVFEYAKDFQYVTTASFMFNAEPGKQTTVTITAFEKGGFTAHLQDRPAFRFETQVTRDTTRKAERAGALPSEETGSTKP